MNCVLYSGLVMKSNQISQNVDTTAYWPITPPTKTNHHWLHQIQTLHAHQIRQPAPEKTDGKFPNP